MTSNDYIAPIIAKLTYNGASNLVGTIEHPSDMADWPDIINGRERIFTGLGKWTTIAAIGVERHLCKLGLAEMRPTGTYWHRTIREDRTANKTCCVTPLGYEVGRYLQAHWKEVAPGLLDHGGRR